MGILQSYRLRLRRKRYLIRALRKQCDLKNLTDRTASIGPEGVLVFSTIRNELIRLPFFLKYYRDLGVRHFFFVDNDSDDGTADYLAQQPDVSLWHTKASYKKARFGIDWLNGLLRRYAHNRWALVLDPDEFFVFPFCDTRPLLALTDWLDASSIKSFSAMLLDMYPRGRFDNCKYQSGQNPLEIAPWFDPGNHTIEENTVYGNLWIQGGVRARVFFPNMPEKAPALNKIPLVKWDRSYCYISSTHMLLPRGLNQVFDKYGGEKASGVLLHTKFIDVFAIKAAEELARRQHYSGSIEYEAYAEKVAENPELWCKWSEQYINWRQLELLGLMSKGNWA